MKNAGSLVVGVVLAGLLVAIAVLIEQSVPPPTTGPALGGQLSPVVEKQIDVIVDLVKLFISWGFAVIAANTFFLKNVVESKVSLWSRDFVLVELAICAGIVSVFFGHLAIVNVVQLLSLDQFSAKSPLVNRYVEYQYWALVAALVITVVLVHGFFWRKPNGTQA